MTSRTRDARVSRAGGGLLLYPASAATDLRAFFRDWMVDAPDELIASPNLLHAPPEPFVPEELRLQPALGVRVCYTSNVEWSVASAGRSG